MRDNVIWIRHSKHDKSVCSLPTRVAAWATPWHDPDESALAALADEACVTTWGGVITVRLRGVKIDRFRSIADQWLPMEGLVVLFGQNSAGKTSVLEAVEHLITQAGRFRADPGEIEETSVDGSLVFDLPGAHIPGSPDAQIYRALLRDEYSRPGAFGKSKYPWPWLDAELAARLKKADLEPAISLLSGALARTGASGTAEDREALANSVFDPSAVYFFAHKLQCKPLGRWLVVAETSHGRCEANCISARR